ncbi:MAG: LytR C-terminal domain-containing protein [Acidimicrobiales bacterium]|nr:LytR C-terminal domain-containing protein [Acidimicrobiales bacterium]MDG2218163.1 LytR C-terminal domain-containing protein [Acidimicrobiales bacterium]
MKFLDLPSAGVRELLEFEDDAPRRLRRRRRPAPKANWFWRFIFPLMVAGAGIAVLLLWEAGTKAVLDSTDGEEFAVVTDPAAPGFEAFVDPTPTMLLVHTDGGQLSGVTVLSQTALDNGGTAVLLSADLLVEVDGVAAAYLREAYTAGGADAVETLVAELFGFGFLERAELDASQLREWMRLVEPVPFNLLDDLLQINEAGDTEVWLSRGRKDLDGELAAQIYGFTNPGESDANRIERQLDLWVSWLDAIGRADDLAAATLPFDDGLSPFLRSLGGGSAEVSILAADVVTDAEGESFLMLNASQLDRVAEIAEAIVPVPIAPPLSARSTVRLLNGTGNPEIRDEAMELLIELEITIGVIGNALEFGVEQTSVTYHRAQAQADADRVAAVLGTVATLVENLDQPVDLTIVIGANWEPS